MPSAPPSPKGAAGGGPDPSWARRRVRPVALAAAVLAIGCSGGGRTPAREPLPPVVLISLDTLRADRLGAYGYRARPVSPHVDALARDGIVFERQMSAAPWTPPAHMSLMTSLAPSAHGVTSSFRELRRQQTAGRVARLDDSCPTLAGALRARGYATAAFTGGMTLDARLGFDRGFEVYETSMFKVQETSYAAMEAWVDGHAERPFFLFWHTFEAHAPYLGTAFLDEVVPAERVGDVRAAIGRYEGRLLKGIVGPAYFLRVLEELGVYRRDVSESLYCGAIARADAWLGRLVARLKRDGIYDRALIVLTSDHGEQFGEDSPEVFYDAHGHCLREELLHVPLVIKLPGGRHAGARVAALTSGIDVMPTVLDVVGIAPPPGLQGRSLRAAWESPASFAERPGFAESLQEDFEEKCIRDGRYKYVVRIDAEAVARHGRAYLPERPAGERLYDLEADPAERHDLLAAGAAPPGVAAALRKELRAHLAARDRRPSEAVIDPETVERLRGLGYLGEEPRR
jgi:arylsulfatase A-like enzyme